VARFCWARLRVLVAFVGLRGVGVLGVPVSRFFALARRQLRALLARHRLLVAHLRLVEFVAAEHAVESRDATHLLDFVDAFSALGLEFVLDGHAVDGVQLVQIPDATFYQFNQDERFDDRVPSRFDRQTPVL